MYVHSPQRNGLEAGVLVCEWAGEAFSLDVLKPAGCGSLS